MEQNTADLRTRYGIKVFDNPSHADETVLQIGSLSFCDNGDYFQKMFVDGDRERLLYFLELIKVLPRSKEAQVAVMGFIDNL